MKKILLLLFLFIFSNSIVLAQECDFVCPAESMLVIEKGNFINKISGVDFLIRNIVETAIKKELHDELYSDVDVKLKLFNIKRLKNGEFKGIELTGNKLQFDALSLSDFSAKSVCPFNKIVYKNNRVYYPHEMPFSFNASITNENLDYILSTEDFKKAIQKAAVRVQGKRVLSFDVPVVEIQNGYLYFELPVKSFLSKKVFKIKFIADVAVDNNKIVLKNVTFNTKSNIIDTRGIVPLINSISPLSFNIKNTDTKFCKINVKEAVVDGDKINISGAFIINKDYSEEK